MMEDEVKNNKASISVGVHDGNEQVFITIKHASGEMVVHLDDSSEQVLYSVLDTRARVRETEAGRCE